MCFLTRAAVLVVLALAFTGCAQTHYTWSGYDTTLYQHYRNPGEAEGFAGDIERIVQEAEAAQKVPPGLYAEYGYLLYEQGHYDQAIEFFEKERALWPESQKIMDTMIENASRSLANRPAQKEERS